MALVGRLRAWRADVEAAFAAGTVGAEDATELFTRIAELERRVLAGVHGGYDLAEEYLARSAMELECATKRK